MTLCMAALCVDDESRPTAVVAADRMVTYGGFIEFEHTMPKIVEPSTRAVVMIAGDTLIGTRLAKSVAANCGSSTPDVGLIARQMAGGYEDLRMELVESQILALRGLSLQSFYGGQSSLNGQVVLMLDQAMQNFSPDIELLIAGVDGSGAHLYTVHNPGKPEREHDFIGYAAIGSGGIHALQAMIGFRHSATATLSETVFRVYAAKRRAEVAPGVGVDTDMAIVSASGVRYLSAQTVESLSALYDSYGKTAEEAQVQELAKLSLEEDGPKRDDDAAPADQGE